MKFSIKRALYLTFILWPAIASAGPMSESDLGELKKQIADLQKSVLQLNEVVKKQQETISTLKVERQNELKDATAPVASEPVAIAGGASRVSGAAPGSLIPEIGVVGDIVASSTESHEDEEGNDRLSVREIELVFGHDIDPYSRFDSTITFSDLEDPDIEEAYVSYWDLPFDLKGKIGRMRQKVGKASAQHRDSLDTVDEPLVVQNLFGVEGLFRTGVELTGFTPLSNASGSFAQELTMGMMEGGVGEDGLLFGETRRKPSFYGHLKNFIEISDTNNFELGGTYLVGSSDDDSAYEVNAFGLDATYVHYFSPINRFKFQNEFYFQDRDEAFMEDEEGNRTKLDSNPWGFYSLADYRLNERWGLGARYDYLKPIGASDEDPRDRDQAVAGYLTFFQSEFARWRFQYEYASLADGNEDNRLYLQGTFAIGAHKHQLQ